MKVITKILRSRTLTGAQINMLIKVINFYWLLQLVKSCLPTVTFHGGSAISQTTKVSPSADDTADRYLYTTDDNVVRVYALNY